jgi:hypothetical protein|tara:strand:+ start:395 stop:1279 length:885 start_codon:yes stop_codon:yes gene_type:complete
MLDLNSSKYLSKDELREVAPSIFSTKPSPEVSKKYSHIPTDRLIDDMELLGWNVIDAKEVNARTKGTKGYQKHLVVFRNDDIVINQMPNNIVESSTSPTGYRRTNGTFAKKNPIDTVFPQILLTNSHDGKNAFTFTAGLFRMVCENGLVISTNEFEKVSIRHMGYDFEELQKQVTEMVKQLPLTVESMNKMIDTQMNQKMIMDFAKDMLAVRFPEDELKRITIDMDEFITPVRPEDKGDDLWSVFNTIQEKIIEGDFDYTVGTKHRKARQIKNFKQDMDLNSKMFDVALEYVNA